MTPIKREGLRRPSSPASSFAPSTDGGASDSGCGGGGGGSSSCTGTEEGDGGGGGGAEPPDAREGPCVQSSGVVSPDVLKKACPECAARWLAADSAESAFGLRKACGGRGRAVPTFTLCDVSAHASESSCWLAAHGRVYDVTDFIALHPGGTESILRHGGQRCEEDYDFHSAGAQAVWARYEVGRLVACKGHPRVGGGGGTCSLM